LRGASQRYSRDQGEFDRAVGFVEATFALALTLLVTSVDVDHPAHCVFQSRSAQRRRRSAVRRLRDRLRGHSELLASAPSPHRLVRGDRLHRHCGQPVPDRSDRAAAVQHAGGRRPWRRGLSPADRGHGHQRRRRVLLYTLVYVVAVRRNLLSTVPSRAEVSYFVVNALAAAVVFAASVPVAYLISPTAARITWICLLPIGWLLSRHTARWRRTTDTA
jgi:hypothetical protein